jgi:hypothetical protein
MPGCYLNVGLPVAMLRYVRQRTRILGSDFDFVRIDSSTDNHYGRTNCIAGNSLRYRVHQSDNITGEGCSSPLRFPRISHRSSFVDRFLIGGF